MITAKQIKVYNLSGPWPVRQERMVFVVDLECNREERSRKEGELEPQPVVSAPAEAEDEPF